MEQKNDVSPDTQKVLLTTREVAQMYGVSEYTITQSWVHKGLKHFRSNPFKFRLEWVEEFIEEQVEIEQQKRQPPICEITKRPKFKRIPKFNSDMRLHIEDFLPAKEC